MAAPNSIGAAKDDVRLTATSSPVQLEAGETPAPRPESSELNEGVASRPSEPQPPRAMSVLARAWIALVLSAGCLTLLAALITSLREPTGPGVPIETLLVFLVLASLTHAFPVVAPGHQAYHVTQAFLLAAVLLMPWQMVALIVLAGHLAEWLRRPRPWYIQTYNTATYLLSAAAASTAFESFGGARPFALEYANQLLAAVLAAIAFLVVNHALTAAVLRMARGVSIRASGLFGPESLGLDALLLALGIPMAGGWVAMPASLVVTAAPLILVYRALELPGLAQGSHRDRLTGLYNRRHFQEELLQELARAEAFGEPVTVLYLVVDDIETVRQDQGGATAEFLMAAVGERLAARVPRFATVARLGSDHLGLLLPRTGEAEGPIIARDLLDVVRSRPFTLPTTRGPLRATVSGSTVTLRESGEAGELLARIERAAVQASLRGPASFEYLPGIAVDGERSAPRAAGSAVPAQTLVGASFRSTAPAWALPLLQVSVVVPSLALTAAALSGLRELPLGTAAILVALTILAEWIGFELYDRSSFSVNFVPILAAVVLLGPTGAVLTTWGAALTRGFLKRSRWDKVLFNGSVFSLGGLVAALVFSAVEVDAKNVQVGPLVAATLAASVAYYLHSFVIAAAIALDLRSSIRSVWTRNFRWLFPHYPFLGLMGLALAIATLEIGLLGTLVFFAPAVVMRFVLKQYTDRTMLTVRRLEATNTELTHSTDLLTRRGEDLALLSDVGELLSNEGEPGRLARRVARRCVPTLGDVCALVVEPSGGPPRYLAVEPRGHPVADPLIDQTDTLWATAEAIAAAGGCSDSVAGAPVAPAMAAGLEGTWLAAPLDARAHRFGWLVAWRPASRGTDTTQQLVLTREVARRVAVTLENGVLLEEAAAVGALQALDRAKSDFIALAAHELRTPLTSLQGFTELLRTQEVEPVLRERWLAVLQSEATQLGLLLDQLLDTSRLDTGEFQLNRQPVDVRAAVDSAIEAFSATATLLGHQITTSVAPGPLAVHADPHHLDHILRNLLSNAIKYSPGGGRIRVEADPLDEGDVQIQVVDEGLGIPKDSLEIIFERFHRVDGPDRATIRGTGLGLFITRRLVELHGGSVWATSAGEGLGATFHVAIPAARTASNRSFHPPAESG